MVQFFVLIIVGVVALYVGLKMAGTAGWLYAIIEGWWLLSFTISTVGFGLFVSLTIFPLIKLLMSVPWPIVLVTSTLSGLLLASTSTWAFAKYSRWEIEAFRQNLEEASRRNRSAST